MAKQRRQRDGVREILDKNRKTTDQPQKPVRDYTTFSLEELEVQPVLEAFGLHPVPDPALSCNGGVEIMSNEFG